MWMVSSDMPNVILISSVTVQEYVSFKCPESLCVFKDGANGGLFMNVFIYIYFCLYIYFHAQQNNLIYYEGSTVDELTANFHEAADDYLDLCKEIGKEPDKSYKGSFNVRVSPDLHKKAAIKAKIMGVSLNQFVITAIEKKLVIKIPKPQSTCFLPGLQLRKSQANFLNLTVYYCTYLFSIGLLRYFFFKRLYLLLEHKSHLITAWLCG